VRVLHLNKFNYRRGGADAYVQDLAAMQRAAGHQVEVLATAHEDSLPATYSALFPAYRELDPPPGPVATVRSAATMVWSREAEAATAAVVAAFAPDVAHLHNVYHHLSPSVLRPLRRAGVPAVMTLHDYKLACPSYQLLDHGKPCQACVGGSLTSAVRRRCKGGSLLASTLLATELGLHRRFHAYDHLGALLCPSDFLISVMRRAGVYPERLRHVPNPVDAEVPVKQSPGGPVLFSGRLAAEKGVDTLVHAAALLRPVGAEPAVVIAGDGPERAALEALADRVAPGRVRFTGRLDKAAVQRQVAAAAVVAAPSRWYENQPLSVLEAHAAGVPVVATAMGGLPELVRPGVDGALVAVDDPAALAAALQGYLDDPVGALAAGAAGRERVLREHGAAEHLRSVDAAYAAAGAT